MNWQGLGFAVGKWALWNSAGAAMVVVFVLGVQKIWGNRISARWRHNLWLLVAVRLLLPAMPGIAISLPQWLKPAPDPKTIAVVTFPIAPIAVAPSQPIAIPIAPALQMMSKADSSTEQLPTPTVAPAIDAAHEQPAFEAKSIEPAAKSEVVVAAPPGSLFTNNPPITTRQESPENATVSHAPVIHTISPKPWVLAIWLVGAVLMLTRLAFNTLQLRRLTRTFQPVEDADLHELLADCCRRTRISRAPVLVKAPSAFGPALIGLWRPRLILPARVLKEFARSEIRAILVHELIHLRRRDVAINYLIALLQAVHWFNPLV